MSLFNSRRRLGRPGTVAALAVAVPLAAASAVSASIVRAARTRRWPWFLLAGTVLAVIGATLLSGVAQAAAAFLGVTVCLFAVVRGLDRDDDYYREEPPVPPGAPGPF
jgi:uncharacterized membrane protein HdeD (DUF308 family)